MSNDNLLPCPFCGGEGEIWRRGGKYGVIVFVKCATCDAQTRVKNAMDNRDDDAFWDQSAVVAVAAMWNRRT